MERLTNQRFVPALARAWELIPSGITDRLRLHVFTGTDPIWAGLHQFEDMTYGRSYRDAGHIVYPYHQSTTPLNQRVTTLVMPKPMTPNQIVHELGHVLDEVLAFEPVAEPVSEYGATCRSEAFAEAFTAWLVLGYSDIRVDDRTIRLLQGLAA